MEITFLDKSRLIFKIYSILFGLPVKFVLYYLLRPVDSVRYLEFSYLLKLLRKEHFDKNSKILDVSSPHMIAYYLAKNNFVLKTNIDESEKRYIKESKNLKFRTVDATKMPFQDDSFDVTYSISVVEHIYEKYLAAIREMVRVTRKKGIIFITFPVSSSHCEEWSRKTMYSHQARKDGKTFFQYRFSKADIQGILDAIGEVRVIACDIFWEKVDGRYDEMIALLSKHSFNNYVRFLRNSFIMFFMGFCLFKEKSQNFSHAKSFGNLQLVLKKK